MKIHGRANPNLCKCKKYYLNNKYSWHNQEHIKDFSYRKRYTVEYK